MRKQQRSTSARNYRHAKTIIIRSIALFSMLMTVRALADATIGRDAVNTVDNHPNYYTKVENSINFIQIIKILAKISSKTIVNASLNLCIEIKNALTLLIKNACSQLINNTVQTAQDTLHSATSTVGGLVWEYKWRLFAATALGLYSYLLYQIVTLRIYFSQHERWFNWNEFLSIDALCMRPQDELGVDLVKEVQRRYTSISAPTDFVTPLIRFLQDIDAEAKALECYLNIGPWVERLRLCTLTGYSSQLAQQCGVWRRRVGYLHATFMRWMADYKLEHNAATRSMIDDRFPTLQHIARTYLSQTH